MPDPVREKKKAKEKEERRQYLQAKINALTKLKKEKMKRERDPPRGKKKFN